MCSACQWVLLHLQFISIRNHCIQADQVVAGCNQFNSLVYICTCNANDFICQLEMDIAGWQMPEPHRERLAALGARWVSLLGLRVLGSHYGVFFCCYHTTLPKRKVSQIQMASGVSCRRAQNSRRGFLLCLSASHTLPRTVMRLLVKIQNDMYRLQRTRPINIQKNDFMVIFLPTAGVKGDMFYLLTQAEIFTFELR